MKKNIFKDLKQITFKQAWLVSFPYIVIFFPLFLATEILNQYINANCISQCYNCGGIDCKVGDWTRVLRWIFLFIGVFPFLRNFFFGAIPNFFKDMKNK